MKQAMTGKKNIGTLPSVKSGRTRKNDAEKTKANIIEVAIKVFSEVGLAGARVDEIAERTKTSKRMLYYYFGNKEGLYKAALEKSYANIRDIESTLDLQGLTPEHALTAMVKLTFNYHNDHPDFVRMVMSENMNLGRYIKEKKTINSRNRMVIETMQNIIDQGEAAGVFRLNIDPVDLHMSISALSFHNVANRHTFSHLFDRDMGDKDVLNERRNVVVDTILRWCLI